MSLPPYPTVPDPSLYVSGPVYVSQLRDDMTNGVNFLANRPGFLGYCTTGPSVASGGSGSSITLDTEQYDNWAGHDSSATAVNTAWYYCQAAGWYLAEGYVPWSYSTATTVSFTTSLALQNASGLTVYPGEQLPVNDTRTPGPYAAELFEMTRTGLPNTSGVDVIVLYGRQNSGGSLDLDASATNYPRLALRWVSATAGTATTVPDNPSWPSPPAYVTSSFLNTNISGALRYLTYPPVARMYYNAGTATLSSGSFPAGTKIALDTVTVDTYSGWSSANNYYVAPAAGVYYIYGQMSVSSAGAAGTYSAGLSVNGGTTTWGQAVRAPSNSSGVNVGCAKRLRLNSGDTVALMGQQSSSSTLTLGGGTTSGNKLILVWETS